MSDDRVANYGEFHVESCGQFVKIGDVLHFKLSDAQPELATSHNGKPMELHTVDARWIGDSEPNVDIDTMLDFLGANDPTSKFFVSAMESGNVEVGAPFPPGSKLRMRDGKYFIELPTDYDGAEVHLVEKEAGDGAA